jgi:hypothetical protein
VSIELVIDVLKVAEHACKAASNLNISTFKNSAIAAAQAASSGEGIVKALMLADVIPDTSFIDDVMEYMSIALDEGTGELIHAYDSLNKDVLPPIPEPNFKQLNAEQQRVTELDLADFFHQSNNMPLEQKQLFHNTLLGETAQKPVGKIDILYLKSIGGGLRSLPKAQKQELVSAFIMGSKKYNSSYKLHPSKDSIFLAAYLSPTNSTNKFQDLINQHLTSHHLSSSALKLLAHPDFPKNIKQDDLISLDSALLRLCDPMKLRLEVARIEIELRKNNAGEILTPQELEKVKQLAEQDELPDVAGLPKPSIDALVEEQAMKKILGTINLADVISGDILTQAHNLKEVHGTKLNQTDDEQLSKQLDQIIFYLNTANCEGKLAELINKNLNSSSKQLVTDLNARYELCFDYFKDKLIKDIHIEATASDDTTGLPNVLPDTRADLDRGFALDFYDKNLKDIDKINQVIANFGQTLSNPNVPTKFPMAKIATFLGLLDPAKDQKEIEAYKAVLTQMVGALRETIINTPNNTELARQFELGLKLIDDITKCSFTSRGERLEERNESKEVVIKGLEMGSKIMFAAAKGSALSVGLAPAAPNLLLASTLFGCASAAAKYSKQVSDVHSIEALAHARSSQELVKNLYTVEKSKIDLVLNKEQLHLNRIEKLLSEAKQKGPIPPDELQLIEATKDISNR